MTELDSWEEFYHVGLDLQSSLRRAQALHSNDGLRLFQVCVLFLLPFSPLSVLALVLSAALLSFLLAAPTDGGRGEGLLHRQLAR
jgi:hypothetical protein